MKVSIMVISIGVSSGLVLCMVNIVVIRKMLCSVWVLCGGWGGLWIGVGVVMFWVG